MQWLTFTFFEFLSGISLIYRIFYSAWNQFWNIISYQVLLKVRFPFDCILYLRKEISQAFWNRMHSTIKPYKRFCNCIFLLTFAEKLDSFYFFSGVFFFSPLNQPIRFNNADNRKHMFVTRNVMCLFFLYVFLYQTGYFGRLLYDNLNNW